MNDIRQPNGQEPPRQPEAPKPQVPAVDLHRRYHEQEAARTASSTPNVAATQTAVPAPAPPPPVSQEPLPQAHEPHHAVDHSLRSIKIGLLVLTLLLAAATVFFISQTLNRPSDKTSSAPSPTETSNQSSGAGQTNPISCLSETGPDLTTTSQAFVDVEGTNCSYKSGPTQETLVLNGKLSGRNTEGTGMSVTISVNGKDCNGGEALNYSRTYTPMFSNCVYVVPANSSVAIKWRFLSPFGGNAAVIRSNKNIAPFISGVAIPKTDSRK